jgi:deoxyribose-phosphate aldolase
MPSNGQLPSVELAKLVDHTYLDIAATPHDIERVCNEALLYGFGRVCVRPDMVKVAKRHFPDIASVVGFPTTKATTVDELIAQLPNTRAKVAEALRAIHDGATEIDMVIDLASLKRGAYDAVIADVRAVARCGVPVKAIIETCFLAKGEVLLASKLAESGGAAYVKTSTGYGFAGAQVKDVRDMGYVLEPETGIKASGGIKDWEQTRALYEASQEFKPHPFRIGASRLGKP